MSYKEQDAPDLIDDIQSRKEFAQLYVPPQGDADDFRGGDDNNNGSMRTHQHFVRTFANPNTPNTRNHLMHSAGCHARGTLIATLDCENNAIVSMCVEDIDVGTIVIRPNDLGFARVIELHHGRDHMYRITPANAKQSYVVNAQHIMYVRDTMRNVAHIEPISSFYEKWKSDADSSSPTGTSYHRAPAYTRWLLEYDNYQYARFTIAPEYENNNRDCNSNNDWPISEYFGFTIDTDDGLFLGADGLILHNSGKCLGRGTPVATRNRGAVRVEALAPDDILIGDDGANRFIESFAHGWDICYRITMKDDGGTSSFICNSAHILTLARNSVEESYHLNAARDDKFYDVLVTDALTDLSHDREYWRSVRITVGQCDTGISTDQSYAIHSYGATYHHGARYHFGTISIERASNDKLEYFGFTLASPSNGRFLLGNGTITHNTMAALAVAQEHIKMYRYMCRGVNWRDPDIVTPTVFVIAFSGRQSFLGDLLKYPEFGYITSSEREIYVRLMRDSIESDESYHKFIEFGVALRKRITNKSRGGFYKFMGYDEFANRLFGASVAQINTIIQEAHSAHELWRVTLDRAIARGQITPNADIIARLENSLIICDEIHNTYNSQTINNRGVALQYALSRARGVRFLSLSATPINSAPSEVADFINYFVENDALALRREDLFVGNTLLTGALARINDALRGHVSFLYDFDPRNFPVRLDDGSVIQLGTRVLPYLRFIPCVMSDYFVNTVRDFYTHRIANDDTVVTDAEIDIDDTVVGISQHAYSLFDIALPNPASDTVGLYNSATTFNAIYSASAEWKTKNGVSTKSYSNGSINTFTGSFLRRKNLVQYSAKYAQLIKMLREIGGMCKIMVYHERVRMSGVILIREILRENGIIGIDDDVNNATLCAVCMRPRAVEHTDHKYRPIRFAILYSEMDATERASILEHYESTSNLHGEWCSILVGSRIIRESLNFTAIRHMFILSLPTSIAQLIQVMGRCVRRGSHLHLPPEERNVRTHILVNIGPHTTTDSQVNIAQNDAIDSPEIRRYNIKLEAYLVVQQIEREIARNAVDAGINKNIITRPMNDSLGFLSYDDAHQFTLSPHLRVDTFFAYGYGAQEIQYTIEIIKKLFKYREIWREDELWAAIHAPPFGVWMNPKLILESSIAIAIAFLTSSTDNVIGMQDRAIYIGGIPYTIVSGLLDTSNLVYMIAPVVSTVVGGIARIRQIVDVESFLRNVSIEQSMIVPISQYETMAVFEESIMVKLREKYGSTTRKQRSTTRLIQFLIEFSSDYQRMVARKFIEDAEFRAEFNELYAFMDSLHIFVRYGYASKYRDIARRLGPDSASTDPIGYTYGTSINLWQSHLHEWTVVGRSALNMHVDFEENNIIIGIFRQFPYAVKFQLRKPLHKLHVKVGTDLRTVERGSVCVTYQRTKVEQIARNIGIKISDIRACDTTNTLCELVKTTLVKYEIKERATHRSRVKYVYGWWDNVLSAF